MSYAKVETETVYSIDQLRYEVEENQLGIGIAEEDGPCNELLAVYLRDEQDFRDWMDICYLHPGTSQPSSYPALAVWFVKSTRWSPFKDQNYLVLPLKDAPWFDDSRPHKEKKSDPAHP